MHLVPIPVTQDALRRSEPIWFPFLASISNRSGEPVAVLYDRIMRGDVQPALIWDGKQASALFGVRFYMQGTEKVAEWVWATGFGRKNWQHLLPDVEQWMRDEGADICKPVCRPGWSKQLKENGYKTTHFIMEKRL